MGTFMTGVVWPALICLATRATLKRSMVQENTIRATLAMKLMTLPTMVPLSFSVRAVTLTCVPSRRPSSVPIRAI